MFLMLSDPWQLPQYAAATLRCPASDDMCHGQNAQLIGEQVIPSLVGILVMAVINLYEPLDDKHESHSLGMGVRPIGKSDNGSGPH